MATADAETSRRKPASRGQNWAGCAAPEWARPYHPTEGPNAPGVSSVTLFASAQGAARWLAQEQRADYIRRQLPGGGKLRRFVVPGIPGARGWTASKAGHTVGNIFWVEGRCLMILGNETTGPFDGPLATGAQAIHQRTKGQCP
jgi:hypothetical protein